MLQSHTQPPTPLGCDGQILGDSVWCMCVTTGPSLLRALACTRSSVVTCLPHTAAELACAVQDASKWDGKCEPGEKEWFNFGINPSTGVVLNKKYYSGRVKSDCGTKMKMLCIGGGDAWVKMNSTRKSSIAQAVASAFSEKNVRATQHPPSCHR